MLIEYNVDILGDRLTDERVQFSHEKFYHTKTEIRELYFLDRGFSQVGEFPRGTFHLN